MSGDQQSNPNRIPIASSKLRHGFPDFDHFCPYLAQRLSLILISRDGSSQDDDTPSTDERFPVVPIH